MAGIDLSEFKRGWTIILACIVGIGCGLSAMPFYTFGAFIVPIQTEFGWSRGEIQSALTLYSLTVFFTLPVIGRVLDRLGVRKVAIASQIAFGLSFASLAFLPGNLILFYAMWMLMAIVSIGTMTITYSYAVNSWFDRYRGIALGVTLSGTGVAATFAPSYAVWLIETFGWRMAFPGMAAITLFFSVPVLVMLLKDAPPTESKSESKPDTDEHSTENATAGAPGLSLAEAVRSTKFWLIGIGMFGVSAGTGGMIPILIPLFTESGFTLAEAAAFAGWVGVMVICGRVLVGLMMDHLWAPLVAFVFFAPSAAAAFLLSGGSISPEAALISVLLIGLVAGAEYDVIAFMVSRYFGMRHFGSIYSWVYIIFISATVAAPFVYGTAYDAFGSYDVPLIGTGILILVGSMALLFLGPVPRAYAPAHAQTAGLQSGELPPSDLQNTSKGA